MGAEANGSSLLGTLSFKPAPARCPVSLLGVADDVLTSSLHLSVQWGREGEDHSFSVPSRQCSRQRDGGEGWGVVKHAAE